MFFILVFFLFLKFCFRAVDLAGFVGFEVSYTVIGYRYRIACVSECVCVGKRLDNVRVKSSMCAAKHLNVNQ